MTNEWIPSELEEELLRRVIQGEVSPDDPDVRSRIDANPAFGGHMQDLLETKHQLDRAAELDLDLIEVGPRAATADDRARTRALLEREAGLRDPRRGGWLLLAAAALVAWFFWGAWGDDSPGSEVPQGLVGSDERCITPKGDTRDFSVFEVDWELGDLWRIEFVVYDAARSTELVSSGRLTETRWTPTDDERARLEEARSILWVFHVYDSTGESRGSGGCSASYSP